MRVPPRSLDKLPEGGVLSAKTSKVCNVEHGFRRLEMTRELIEEGDAVLPSFVFVSRLRIIEE